MINKKKINKINTNKTKLIKLIAKRKNKNKIEIHTKIKEIGVKKIDVLIQQLIMIIKHLIS